GVSGNAPAPPPATQPPPLPVGGGELRDGLVRRAELVFERAKLRIVVDDPPRAAVLLVGGLGDFPAVGGFLVRGRNVDRWPLVIGTDRAAGQRERQRGAN